MKEQQLIGSLEKLAEQIGIVITDLKKYHKDKPNEPDTFQVGDEVEEARFSLHKTIGIVMAIDRLNREIQVKSNDCIKWYKYNEWKRVGKEKSLHDQIKEGGWDFIFDLAKEKPSLYFLEHIEDKYFAPEHHKIGTYVRLLALSKVLNEGKEKSKDWIYTVEWGIVGLKGIDHTEYRDTHYAIEFYTKYDRDFAQQFAEKEWKTFYNQE